MAWADTISWPFTTGGNYAVSDATKVEVADGVAKLIAIDQTDDDNTSTGFGGGTHNETQWDGTDNWLELTAAGQTNGSGDFVSRVMDAGRTAAWDSISWTPQGPLYKELPDGKGIESGYPEANADMTGNVLLMHMNEASGTIVDFSGEGNNGTLVGDGDEYGGDGKFNTCMDFDGNDYVAVSGFTDLNGASELSVEMWMKQDQTTQGRYALWRNGNILINIGDNYGTPGPTNLRLRLNLDGTWRNSHTALDVLDTGVWHHWAFVYDGTYARIYEDGQEIYSSNADAAYNVVSTGSGNLQVGFRDGISGLDGLMDEIAIYSRDLSAQEISDHYKRGSLRLKYQVRSGSSNPPTGNFIGPDSTTGTYYSELLNSTLELPSLSLTNVDNNRYFQYRAYFETDTFSYSPELKSVVIGPTHYPGDNPTVQNNAGQTYALLNSFVETLGAGNAGSVRYQVSNNGTNWYYWNFFCHGRFS